MIVDTVENISRYAALGGNLARGLEFLQRSFSQVVPDGRQSIFGDAVYATASTYVTEPKTAKLFEAHDRYIDIQYLFQGEEALYWAPRSSLTVTNPYSESKDVAKLSGEGTEIMLVPGVFVVLFPWDGHMPGCVLHAPAQVKKLVIKALAL
jgi:YhcH/YjgK/YiaL family protein